MTSERTVATDEAYPHADASAIGRATLISSGDMPRPTLRLTPWPRLTALPTVAGGTPVRFELLDRSGGQSGGVGVDGRLAYLIVGGRIEVIDAADPRRLARFGRTPPLRHAPKLSSDVVAHGGIVAASTGDGVVIVDARDPRSPVEAGWIPLEGDVMRLVGNERMVAAFVSLDFMGPSGVQLLDVSDPDRPRLGGFVELIGLGSALALQDDTLWALTSPSWNDAGAILSGRIASEMGSRNGLVDLSTSGLRRIDVSDIDQPREIRIADFDPVHPADDFMALAVDSDRLYVFEQIEIGATTEGKSVRVAQFRPGSPEIDILGEWRENDSQIESDYRWSAQVTGRRLVISHVGEQGVKVLDVSDPLHPTDLPQLNAALAQVSCRLNALPAGPASQMWLTCADGPRIVDVGEHAAELELGRYAPTDPPTLRRRSARPMPALFAGGLLWKADDGPMTGVDDRPGPSVLEGWRVPASGEPALAGTWLARWAVDALAADGRYLYAIGNNWGDVSIVDIHDPDHPVELTNLERSRARKDRCAQIDTMRCGPQSASSAVVVGGTLLIGYLSGGEDGSLEMIDVQDPRHPVEAGWVNLRDTGYLAAGIDTAWAFVWGDPWASLRAIDLRQVAQGGPMVQEVEGLSQTPDGCMAAMGHRAFVAQLLASGGGPRAQFGVNAATLAIRSLAADPDGSVRVTDAITLSQQARREYAFPSCVAVVDDDLMVLHVSSGVADYPGQLYAIDVSNPDRRVVRGAYRGEAWPVPFAIRDHTLYELSNAGLSRWSIGP